MTDRSLRQIYTWRACRLTGRAWIGMRRWRQRPRPLPARPSATSTRPVEFPWPPSFTAESWPEHSHAIDANGPTAGAVSFAERTTTSTTPQRRASPPSMSPKCYSVPSIGCRNTIAGSSCAFTGKARRRPKSHGYSAGSQPAISNCRRRVLERLRREMGHSEKEGPF